MEHNNQEPVEILYHLLQCIKHEDALVDSTNVLRRILRGLNCSSGSIYLFEDRGQSSGMKKFVKIPKNIHSIDHYCDYNFPFNACFSKEVFFQYLNSLPLTIEYSTNSIITIQPIGKRGVLILERKFSSVSQEFFEMLKPILNTLELSISRYEDQLLFHQIKMLFDESKDGILLTDAHGQVVDTNRCVIESLRREKKNVIGRNIDEFIDYPGMKTELFLEGKKYGHLLTQENNIPIKITIHKEPQGIAYILNDYQAEKEKQIQKQLIQSTARMAELGSLASNLAHELANPLTIISGCTKILLSSSQDDKEKKLLEKVLKAQEKATFLLDSLRKISRDGSKEDMNTYLITSLIEESVEVAKGKFKDHNIEFSTEGPEISIYCNATQIGQVLINLLNNSIFELRDKDERWIRISWKIVDQMCYIYFTDSGHGIPKDVVSKMFHQFYTTKGREEGTGIGLHLSKSILQKHEGDLIYNEKSPNTEFILKLPNKSNL